MPITDFNIKTTSVYARRLSVTHMGHLLRYLMTHNFILQSVLFFCVGFPSCIYIGPLFHYIYSYWRLIQWMLKNMGMIIQCEYRYSKARSVLCKVKSFITTRQQVLFSNKLSFFLIVDCFLHVDAHVLDFPTSPSSIIYDLTLF